MPHCHEVRPGGLILPLNKIDFVEGGYAVVYSIGLTLYFSHMKRNVTWMMLVLVGLAVNCRLVKAQDLVAIGEDGQATFLVDEEALLGELNQFVRQNADLPVDFTEVEVVQGEDSSYVLLAKGQAYRTAIALEESKPGTKRLHAGKLSCTSSCGAHPGACMPDTGDMTCVPVCDSGTCSRTVSSENISIDVGDH